MLKSKQTRIIAFALVSILLSATIFFSLDSNLGNAFTIKATTLSLTDGKLVPISDIYCFTKHIGYVLDAGNIIIDKTDPSSASQGNPFLLAITSEKGLVAKFIKVDLKGRCSTGIPDLDRNGILSESEKAKATNQTPLLAHGEFTVKVFSKDNTGKFVNTITKSITTPDISLQDGKEKNFGTVFLDMAEVQAKLPKGSYESYQKIEVSGLIKLKYKDFVCPVCTFVYVIPTEKANPENAQVSWVKLKVAPTGAIPIPDQQTCDDTTSCAPPVDVQCEANDTCVSETNSEDYGFLNYKLLLTCSNDFKCYDNALFTPLYAIGGILVLFGIIESTKKTAIVGLGTNGVTS